MKKIISSTLLLLSLFSSFVQSESKHASYMNNHSIVYEAEKNQKKLYEKRFDDKVLLNRSSKQEYGYLVESRTYKNKDEKGEVGSVISVTSPTGEVLALLDFPDKRGILNLDSRGQETFLEEKKGNFDHDTLVDPAQKKSILPFQSVHSSDSEIDFLAGYNLSELPSDPIAHALLQLESARQALENSEISGIKLKLGGVVIIDEKGEDYDVSGNGLNNWQTTLAPYRDIYKTDINMSFSLHDTYGGMASIGGYSSVNSLTTPNAFRHELGHNVGGNHCNEMATDDYKFGYKIGESETALCGNSSPYYSNPDITDSYGLPLGDKKTADMARLWREQAKRMADYNPGLRGEKLLFVSQPYGNKTAELEIQSPEGSISTGFVAIDAQTGPTALDYINEGFTTLTVKLKNYEKNEIFDVKLRAQRKVGPCNFGPMNNAVGCSISGPLTLKVFFDPSDNLTLEKGVYNGLLELSIRDKINPNTNIPVNVIIALAHYDLFTPPFDQNDAILKDVSFPADKDTFSRWTYEDDGDSGLVAFHADQAPTQLVWWKDGTTEVPVLLRDEKKERTRKVILDVSRRNDCGEYTMNSVVSCGSSHQYVDFIVRFDPKKNPSIPTGKFSGILPLKIKHWSDKTVGNILYRIQLDNSARH